MLINKWEFSGEVVRLKDFGDGKGGNVLLRGASNGSLIEVSSFLPEKEFQKIFSVEDYKFKMADIKGHFEIFVKETSGGNVKNSLKLIGEQFAWI